MRSFTNSVHVFTCSQPTFAIFSISGSPHARIRRIGGWTTSERHVSFQLLTPLRRVSSCSSSTLSSSPGSNLSLQTHGTTHNRAWCCTLRCSWCCPDIQWNSANDRRRASSSRIASQSVMRGASTSARHAVDKSSLAPSQQDGRAAKANTQYFPLSPRFTYKFLASSSHSRITVKVTCWH